MAVVLAARPHRTEVDRLWRAFLRRFDLEHTFRFLTQTLGWTRPRIRTPTQRPPLDLAHRRRPHPARLARHLTQDLRRPWEKPVTEPHRLTPARIRRGFAEPPPEDHPPASAPKPSRPGPGRPPGSKNKHHARRHDVGKNATRRSNDAKTG